MQKVRPIRKNITVRLYRIIFAVFKKLVVLIHLKCIFWYEIYEKSTTKSQKTTVYKIYRNKTT